MKGTLFIFLLLLGPGIVRNLPAHESLYNTAEIQLTSPEIVTVHFSIHAPEVILDSVESDLSELGDEWLMALSDSEVGELITKSRIFVKERYQVAVDGVNLLEGVRLEFESPTLIRTPDREGGPRPGCLLATLTFRNQGGFVEWIYTKGGEKRLLLAEIRPASFPRTHDLEAGTAISIQLPEPPPSPKKPWGALAISLAFAVLAGLVIRSKLSTLSKQT